MQLVQAVEATPAPDFAAPVIRVPERAGHETSVDPNTFRDLFGGHPAGVSVITTRDLSGAPIGMTVSAVMSLSLTPPQLVIALDNAKYTLQAIIDSGTFAVNFLAGDQAQVSDWFARSGDDRFLRADWSYSKTLGLPQVSGVRAIAECLLDSVITSGDHTLLVGHIVAADVENTPALAYCARTYGTVAEANAAGSGRS